MCIRDRVITIVSSALILHEAMTPVMWLGTALALGGLILSEHRDKPPAGQERAE